MKSGRNIIFGGALAGIALGVNAQSVPPPAAPAGFDERLRKLEEEVQSLRKENQELKSMLGDGKGGLITVKPAGKEVTLKLGGLLQAQADFLDKGDSRWGSDFDRFYLRRARLNASGTFLEDFDFKIELELSGSLGEASGLRAGMTDGYINYNRFEWANVRMGQFKSPYGFEQLYADPRLFTIERSLPNDRLTMGRQLGAMVTGDLLEKRLSYASGVFNGNGLNTSANDNDSFMWVGRGSGVPWQGKLWGKEANWSVGGDLFASDDSSITGMNDFLFDSTPATPALDGIFAGYRTGASVDSQLKLGPLEIWAEYFRTRFEVENQIPLDAVDAEGWYAQATYYILPDKLQGVVKFETFDPEVDLVGNTTDVWTFGLNYYIKGHDLKAQLNYLLFDATGQPNHESKILLRMQAVF